MGFLTQVRSIRTTTSPRLQKFEATPSKRQITPKTKGNFNIFVLEMAKGQLISELNCDVFKSPQKPTKFLIDF